MAWWKRLAGAGVALAVAARGEKLLQLEKVSQTYIPFQYAADGTPSFCYDAGVSEQITFHKATSQLIVVGSDLLQVYSLANLTNPVVDQVIAVDAAPTDVESCGEYVAVSFENADAVTLPGSVKVYSSNETLAEVASAEVGALPDMLTWTSDCSKIVVANEGEAGTDANGVFVNPEGSVSIIDVEKLLSGAQDAVKTADFKKFNKFALNLVQDGVRWVWRGETLEAGAPLQTFSMDMEPEYIALSKDDKTAYVVLQENNAIAVVDIDTANMKSILPLGLKDWRGIQQQMDPVKDNGVSMAPWKLFGMFQPDAISSFEINGELYLVIANEGDAKEYTMEDQAVPEWVEEADAADIADDLEENFADTKALFARPDITLVRSLTVQDALSGELGSLTVSAIDGGFRPIAGGNAQRIKQVVTYGARSFSILQVTDKGKFAMVFDSGSDMEERHATHFPTLWNMDAPDGWCPEDGDADGFNTTGMEGSVLQFIADSEDPEAAYLSIAPPAAAGEEVEVPEFLVGGLDAVTDARSDNKGPETEAIKVADIGGMKVLFVANERTSTVFMYDVTNPTEPAYMDAVYGGELFSEKTFLQMYLDRELGDIDPEGIEVVPAESSPSGVPLLIVAGALSGTFSVYEIVESAPAEAGSAPSGNCTAGPAGGAVVGFLSTEGITLSDVDPDATVALSYPPKFDSVKPRRGSFAVPLASRRASKANVQVPRSIRNNILSGPDCKGRSPLEACFEYPGIFSGFTRPTAKAGDGEMFMAITDRGPTQSCEDVAGLGFNVAASVLQDAGAMGFPTPDYSPTITFLTMGDTDNLELVKTCPLLGKYGERLNGLSPPTGGTPKTKNCATPLKVNRAGVDPEEIQPIGDSGWCLVVEEYYPSVLVVKCDHTADGCGEVHTRYVPKGVNIRKAPYEVKKILPRELIKRKTDRGFEAAAVSPDGTKALVFLQSPLVDATAANTTALRAVELSLTLNGNEEPTVETSAMYVHAMDPYWNWEAAESMDDVQVSAAAWLGSNKVLLLERAAEQVKLFSLDFTMATNLLDGTSKSQSLLPERTMDGDGRDPSITPVAKGMVMDSALVQGWTEDINGKQEGLAIINSCTVALAADSEFGLEGRDRSNVVLVQLDTCLPEYEDSPFSC